MLWNQTWTDSDKNSPMLPKPEKTRLNTSSTKLTTLSHHMTQRLMVHQCSQKRTQVMKAPLVIKVPLVIKAPLVIKDQHLNEQYESASKLNTLKL